MDFKGKKKRKTSNNGRDHQDPDRLKLETDDSEEEYSEEEQITYVEETSESEPELECDCWDEDCRIIEKRCTDISTLTGYHLMPTCSKDPEMRPKKKQKIVAEINDKLVQKSFTDNFHSNWNSNTSITMDNFELIINPFKFCIVNNFLENVDFLNLLQQELYELDWNNRNMDLYEFYQSKDLKYLNSEHIRSLYTFLKKDVMKWVAELTGFNLTDISATCSLYSNTDYLLVHDDQREDRMVAFVLYLTGDDGWSKNKGGSLQLLSKDQAGHPDKVVRDVLPANNQLVFFPVTNDSYHQVAEVTTINDCRLSVNGWFHSKTPPVYPCLSYTPLETSLYGKSIVKPKKVDIELESWINEDYLDTEAIKQIQQYVEENSEISLKRFFRQESFNAVLQTLRNEDLNWVKVGPPNRHLYEVLDTRRLPHSLERFLSLFQSTEMFSLLHLYTDLDLISPTGSMKFELQRWTPGCYSLLTDYNWQEKNELDLIIYFGCSRSSDVIGARTQYVTLDDEVQNALITIDPEENNLNIVYRDLARFTKYFSKQSKCQTFYCLVCSYSEC